MNHESWQCWILAKVPTSWCCFCSQSQPWNSHLSDRLIEEKQNQREMEVSIYIDLTAWLCFFIPHCMMKTFRKQNLSQKKPKPSEFTTLISEYTGNSIRSPVVREAKCLLGFKASLHRWEENWLKAIKHKDMTFGSGRPWSANCWHIWDKDHTGLAGSLHCLTAIPW